MGRWNHWQNERGVLTGIYGYRDSSWAEESEREQSATSAHHGSLHLTSTSVRGLTDTVIDTFGDSGKWSILINYRIEDFPSNGDFFFRFTTAFNQNLIALNTPGSATQSAIVTIGTGFDLTQINTFNWDLTGDFYTPNTDSRTQWMHFVMTYDSSQAAADELTFYTYGVETTPTSTTINGSTNQTQTDRSLQVGSILGLGSKSFIHQIAVWEDKVLSADEVKAMYNQGGRDFDLDRNHDGYEGADQLVNWWRMCSNSVAGFTFADSLNNAFDLLDAGNITENVNGHNYSPGSSYIELDGAGELFLNDNGGVGQAIRT